jgi:hypothetical protein
MGKKRGQKRCQSLRGDMHLSWTRVKKDVEKVKKISRR